MMPSNPKYLQEARESDPEGRTCGYCLGPNDMADDVGFWYVSKAQGVNGNKEFTPCCHECWDKLGFVHYGER